MLSKLALALAAAAMSACAAFPSLARQDAVPLREGLSHDDLLTVAERSDFKATARYEQVVTLLDTMARASDLVRRVDLGTTHEGRSIPAIVIADPPVDSAHAAARSGKLVVMAIGNIHAGEVDGKEALPILARELITTPDHPLLNDLILIFAPIYNADGNERVGPDNRPGQLGPDEGMGQRHNAQDLDLNRDFVKLAAPETRALLRFVNEWDPAILIDTHTTNGSLHRYVLTYDGPKHPAGDPHVIAFARDTLFPAVTAALAAAGTHTFYYGNFAAADSRWEGYPAQARYGVNYLGIRNRLGILSEGYAYAPYKDRVLATRDFVRAVLSFAAEHKDQIKTLLRQADERTIAAGREPSPDATVAVRARQAPFDEPVSIRGFERTSPQDRDAPGAPLDRQVEHWNRFDPEVSVARPFAYLIPGADARVVELLQRHGLEVEELREDVELDVETYTLDAVRASERPYQGFHQYTADATPAPAARRVPAGTVVVRTAQKLGSLACVLLEPASDDGLLTWGGLGLFDDAPQAGAEFPVLRLPAPAPILTTRVRPLPEDRTLDKRISFEALVESDDRPDFNGSPAGGMTWIDDTSYLQARDDVLYVVDARTGRSRRFHDPEPMARALAALPTVGEGRARDWAGGSRFTMTQDRSGALFEHDNDLYFARFDGSLAVRLTSSPQREEYPAFSPDGAFVAFIRDNDLWAVDIATQSERQLTTGGTDLVRNAKNDWVYFEELYGRSWRSFWWSPDSQHIAFLQVDSSHLPTFTIVDDHPQPQRVESERYPRAGEPNPHVRLGIVSASGGSPRWADLSAYDQGHFLISHVGWWSDSSVAYFYVQDRIQTWLDLCTVSPRGGSVSRLLRDSTQAWIESPGNLSFLRDGSFLIASERSGWRHLYHYARDGSLIAQVTSGEWEARDLEILDEDDAWVYLSGTRDSHIAQNLYRARLDGSAIERLTFEPGSHNASVSPGGDLFIDSWSSREHPTRVALRSVAPEPGSAPEPARTIDTNPVYVIEEYRFGRVQPVQVPMSDGFLLEAFLVVPPDFDQSLSYPVWVSTYAGPHAPTVSDSWGGGRTWHQMLADMGFIVFAVDPRSASGKGAVSAWTAYKQLGVPELKDLEDAVAWLAREHPFVDPARVGISGFSYGGFITAYALTHSTAFAAGISGAPVTDWRDYDSIYTERYMDTPQNNPDGYERTSCVKAARNLHGALLLIHGTMDDNVHMQNSIRFIKALQDADKHFELMIYPGSRHGIGGRHYQTLQRDFIRRSLGGPRPRDHDAPTPSEADLHSSPALEGP